MRSDVALGFRVHSGWAAVVALSAPASAPSVLDRARIHLADPENPGPFQPYHTAAGLSLGSAEAFLQGCSRDVLSRARSSLGQVLSKLRERGLGVCGCGILFGSGRRPGTLAEILSSHAMIHTAEGEFFRKAVVDASEHYGLPVTRVVERDLWTLAEKCTNIRVQQLRQHLTEIGKSVGPPWREDEKYASIAAWMALAGPKPTSYLPAVRS